MSGFYWLATLPLVLAGGGVVWLYLASGVDISPIIALHLGLATPSLIDALATAGTPARTGTKART